MTLQPAIASIISRFEPEEDVGEGEASVRLPHGFASQPIGVPGELLGPCCTAQVLTSAAVQAAE